jgi:hypothetical protein
MKKLSILTILALFVVAPVLSQSPNDYSDSIPEDASVDGVDAIQKQASIDRKGLLNQLFSFTTGDQVDPGEDVVFRQSLTLDPNSDICGKWEDWGLIGEPIYIMTEFHGPDGKISEDYEAYWCETYDSVISRGFTAPSSDGVYDYRYEWNLDDSDVDQIDGVGGQKVFSSESLTVGDGESSDDGGDGSEPEPVNPEMALSQTPGFTVDEEENTVTGTLGIKNVGEGDMSSEDIVEMQVRPYGEGPLSFVSSTVDTCDIDYPNNVHKEYSIDAGDSESVSLTNQGFLSDGESYTVYFLTRSGCGGEKVEPIYNSYNAGTFTLEEEQVEDPEPEPEPESQNVVELSKPQLTAGDNNVTVQISFKNEGGDMPDRDIVEMQVRPKGTGPISAAFSENQMVCDSQYPNNVHKTYDLESGEKASTTLSVDGLEDGTEYDVFLLTREDCFPNNEKVDPYFNSVRAGTFETSDDTVDPATGIGLLPIVLVGAGLAIGGALIFG